MLFSQSGLLFALTAVVSAAPIQQRWFRDWWHPDPSASYLDFGKRQPFSVDTQAASCSLADAYKNMPQASPSLPPPAPGLSLSHVAIGRGTQNYTCDLSNATAVPAAVGAVASLFNTTCMAASSPFLLARLPAIALDLPPPSATDESSPAYQDLSGHHYFTDLTTAYFNMDTAAHQYGTGAFKKAAAVPAPSGAPAGQAGQGFGSVPWLKLDAKTADGQVFQEVYRLNTAGGNPPKTCQGQPAAFQVEYAAEYWLFE